MKEVRVSVYYSGYFGNLGNGLEDALLSSLKHSDKFNSLKEELNKVCNIEFIDRNFDYDSEEYNSYKWSEDNLAYFNTPFWDLFVNEIYLDFQFGKELKLFDFIDTSVFRSHSVMGNLFIELLNEECWIFIVNRRSWKSVLGEETKLHLELLMGHEGYERKMMEKFLGTYKIDK